MSFIIRLITVVTFNLILVSASSSANAALIVTWQFDQPSIIAQPSDRIPITATISNSASSDQTFDPFQLSTYGYSTYTGNPAYEYYYERDRQYEFPGAGYDTLWNELGGLVLAPGESHQFLFFVLVPSNGITGGGFVPPGTYNFGDYILHFDSNAGTDYTYYFNAQNNFSVTVVPVPATIWLLVSGMAGLVGVAARNRKHPEQR